ncbi:MAG TPA: PVC-type heme-binding CxxCH protein [Verrucomicrobiae bacterium]|nr:PVC-type heme-binding CxxCH protein [Verrucomicrobiae bacterium]
MSRLCAFLVLSASWAWASDAPAPVPVAEAVRSITLPQGFKTTLFAGEPDLVQPIALTTDARGRLWVVECLSYPNWTTNKTGEDRVSIYEDTDADGIFDKKTVFWNKGRNLSGIALGFGGVWLCSLPELIFIRDQNGDDKPDGEPVVLLDGWDLASKHNAFNGLTWGPDGWLYGCNGILGNSHVGKPGASEAERIPMNCGVWRYHPTQRVFEVVANGTTNPWGIAFNDVGQMFVANCVIKHLFHIVPGAHYERMFGQDFNPYLFELIPSIADHIHWAGGYWKTEGADNPQNDVTGGGHAHCGAMIYLGESWPETYRNTFFTINIHGHRVNNDLLVPEGSSYVGKHRADFMRVNDTWFRGVSVIPSSDGGAFVSDWCDAGECHDYDDIHRENGRIFKINYNGQQKKTSDLRQMPDNQLLSFQTAKDEWLVNQSRLILQERAEGRNLQPTTPIRLREMFKHGANLHDRLRAFWALHVIGESSAVRQEALVDSEEYIRAWAVQFATADSNPRNSFSELVDLAQNDSSPVVRLYLASALQRLALEDRVDVASGLAAHAEDATDPYLPLMIWYGIEPVAGKNEAAALKLLEKTTIPLVRRFLAERLALRLALNGLTQALAKSADPDFQADVTLGMYLALNGRRQLAAPEGWDVVARKLENSPARDVRDEAIRLSLTFGDETALREMEARANDKSGKGSDRKAALEALVSIRRPEFVPLFQKAVTDPALRRTAINALAAYDNPQTPDLIISEYGRLNPEEKAEAINTLSSRASFAAPLLEAVRDKRIPARDITPFSARQIQAYKDPRLESLLKDLGTFRGVSGEKATQIARYKKLLTSAVLGQADPREGRAVFKRTCASCHSLFDDGGKLAPELTGSQRGNLDYILENVVDPNAVVWDRYKAAYFETSDDRLISGIIVRENEGTVTIQTQTGTVTLPRTDIVKRTQSNLSMMPEGLLEALSDQEIVNLVDYLQSPTQVPLPAQ